MLPDNEWRCDICRSCVYWYGTWEKPRLIAETYNNSRVSICENCEEQSKQRETVSGLPYYSFIGITTIKIVNPHTRKIINDAIIQNK